MDSLTLIAVISIIMAGLTTGFGTMGPALAEGRAVATALTALAQQPDASATITRTLFVGLAMIESTAIYCFVVSMILIFANPFWNAAVTHAAAAPSSVSAAAPSAAASASAAAATGTGTAGTGK
jgi:F-type H+-transporting ATPase subunit c